VDEHEYFNATHPCLARPDRHRRAGPHRDVRTERRNLLQRLIAKVARRY